MIVKDVKNIYDFEVRKSWCSRKIESTFYVGFICQKGTIHF